MATDELKWVRGFNYQPSWGSHGLLVWNDFKPELYALEIDRGLRHFPKINTLRVWLSFDAYVNDPAKCIDAIRQAAKILRERKLKVIPVLFCGWHSIPAWGGFTLDSLHCGKRRKEWAYEKTFAEEATAAFAPEDILAVDLANEPFCSMGHKDEQLFTRDFLKAVADHLHDKFPKIPVTCGTWGMFNKQEGGCWDTELLEPFLDVISLHAYSCFFGKDREEFLELLDATEIYLKRLGKPVIVTECAGFANSDENADKERAEILAFEMKEFVARGWGILPHALHHSKVADLHRDPYLFPGGRKSLHFIEADGTLRPYHGIYNDFC